MKTIYKYRLALDAEDTAQVALPVDAELLHVDLQGSDLQLWAMVDTDLLGEERRYIMVKGTGHEIPDHLVLTHINSLISMGGSLVLHAFEVMG